MCSAEDRISGVVLVERLAFDVTGVPHVVERDQCHLLERLSWNSDEIAPSMVLPTDPSKTKSPA